MITETGIEQVRRPQCVRGEIIEGRPGVVHYHFDTPLSYHEASRIISGVADAFDQPRKDGHRLGFLKPSNEGQGSSDTVGFVLEVPRTMNTEEVDRLFAAINRTGLMEICMPLSPYPPAPKPIVDRRVPMYVPLEHGEQLDPGYEISSGQDGIRSKIGWRVLGVDGRPKDMTLAVEVPEGKKLDDMRVVTANDDPNQMVPWMFTDGKQRMIRRGDIPKEL